MSSPIVLADTNVIIELVKSKPDPQVMRWLQSVQLEASCAMQSQLATRKFRGQLLLVLTTFQSSEPCPLLLPIACSRNIVQVP